MASAKSLDGGSSVTGGVQDTEDNAGFAPAEENRRLSANEETSKEALSHPRYTITARELINCIIASESTRAIFSILIALLAVLSHVDYQLVGVNIVNSKSFVATKPLYMVLLSDITVVVANFILSRRGLSRTMIPEDEAFKKGSQEGLNWARAVMVLERGLVLHHTVRAVFIDCSIYVVIVACGLSVVKST